MRLDLHIHTTASDGAWGPSQVAQAAAGGRLDVIAVADHDTTAGVGPAIRAAAELHLQVIPAVELSSTRAGQEIHILGYFVDPDAPVLREHEIRAAELREARIVGMIEKLKGQGVHVAMDAVLEVAGPDRSSLGRPHLARALVAAGHAATVPEAFDRYLGDRLPAFVPTELTEPARAVEVIRTSGGLAVWAHPPAELVDRLLPELVRAGLRGIEVYRPRSHPDQVLRLERTARSAGLLMSGGSDWHTPDAGASLGDFYVTGEEIAPLLEAGGM